MQNQWECNILHEIGTSCKVVAYYYRLVMIDCIFILFRDRSPPVPPMIRESTSEYMTRRREDVEGARRLRARLERERARREREEREEEERRELEERRQLEEALKISQQDYVKQRNEEKLMQKALQASRQEFDEENQLKSGILTKLYLCV